MDLNVNKLPETDDARLKPNTAEEAPRRAQPEAHDSSRLLKIGAFLAVVVVMTALAMNSHTSTQSTMAPDEAPAVSGATTLPAAPAPTTGRAPVPTIAPNSPSEAAEGANSNQ
jgi:hypothetical protein